MLMAAERGGSWFLPERNDMTWILSRRPVTRAAELNGHDQVFQLPGACGVAISTPAFTPPISLFVDFASADGRATRAFVGAFPVENDDGVESRIQPLDARAKIFEAFHRAELTLAQLRCDVQRALEAQWHYRTSPAPVVSAIYFGSWKRWWEQ